MSGWRQRIRERRAGLIGAAVGIALIAVVFLVVLPVIADPRDVWDVIEGLSLPWIAALAVAAAINVATFAPPYMAALPGLRFRPALAVTTASTASTYLAPGGLAVGVGLSFAMLRGWSFRGRPVTLAITVVTIWNQFMIFGSPLVALAMLTATGGSNALLRTSAYAGVAIFVAIVGACVLALASERLARRGGDVVSSAASGLLRMIGRGAVAWSGEALVEFRSDALSLLRARWHSLTLATLAGHLTVYLVMILSLRALAISGGQVSLAESFAAWALVRLLGQIAITPGGFGIVELGMTGVLVAFGGPQNEVVAAVLVYRFLTVAPPVLLGALFAATWQHQNPGWEQDRPTR